MKDQEIKTVAITISTPDLKKLEELEKAGRENDSIENDNFPAESKALQIKNTFEPMVKMIEAVETEFNEIIDSSKVEVTKDVAKNARALRLKIAKIRTGAETARKAQKASIILQGKAIDGACNVVKWAVSSKEEALEKIENYQKEQEALAIRKLQADRVDVIIQYYPDAIERDFTKLSEKEFLALVDDKKRDAEEKENLRIENEKLRKEADEKARLDKQGVSRFETLTRLGVVSSVSECRAMASFEWDNIHEIANHSFHKKQEEEQKESDRLKKIENERIEKEQAEKSALEAKAKAEREENEKLRAQLKAREDEEKARLEAEEKKRIESEMKEREISAIQFLTQNGFVDCEGGMRNKTGDWSIGSLHYSELESNDELEQFKNNTLFYIEQRKEKKAEAERIAKEQAELKAIADKEALRQVELNKGDAEKVKELVDELGLLKEKYSFKSESNQKMYSEFGVLIDKTINHILK